MFQHHATLGKQLRQEHRTKVFLDDLLLASKNIEDHIEAISENERALEKICMRMYDKLGDNFLKTKSDLKAAK